MFHETNRKRNVGNIKQNKVQVSAGFASFVRRSISAHLLKTGSNAGSVASGLMKTAPIMEAVNRALLDILVTFAVKSKTNFFDCMMKEFS